MKRGHLNQKLLSVLPPLLLSHIAMFFSPLKQSVSGRINSAPRFVLPNLGYVIGQARNSNLSSSLVKSASPYLGLGLSISCKWLYSCRAVRKNSDTSHVKESWKGLNSDLLEEANITTSIRVDGIQHFPGNVDDEDNKKTRGRKKKSHGNKGRVPWNKGRKHSDETRDRISRKTREALQDPKIRVSLAKLWGRRLRLKRTREKFVQLWAESIALAAKKGGADQQELEWDSYEKFKQEEALQHAKEAKLKALRRIRKEREAKVKAALKVARLAQKKREREESAEVRQVTIRKRNKWSKEEKEKLVEFQEEKLKERLMKIKRKKSTLSRVSSQHERTWEKFDLDLAQGKHLQKDISLADQIRSAKKRRAELLLDKL